MVSLAPFDFHILQIKAEMGSRGDADHWQKAFEQISGFILAAQLEVAKPFKSDPEIPVVMEKIADFDPDRG